MTCTICGGQLVVRQVSDAPVSEGGAFDMEKAEHGPYRLVCSKCEGEAETDWHYSTLGMGQVSPVANVDPEPVAHVLMGDESRVFLSDRLTALTILNREGKIVHAELMRVNEEAVRNGYEAERKK